jgi:hypothetical protein
MTMEFMAALRKKPKNHRYLLRQEIRNASLMTSP